MMKISVVLPAYNEKRNLKELVLRIREVLRKLKLSFEIICVIQGTDGTLGEIKKLKNSGFSELRIFHYEKPLGIGPAFKIGFSKVSKSMDMVLTMDADLNHQPEELPSFIERMKKGDTDIVIGSRYIPKGKVYGMPIWKRVVSTFANVVMSVLFGFGAKDKSSGYRLYKTEVINGVISRISSRNFEVYPEILMIVRDLGYRMSEMPIVFKVRVHGRSKMSLISTGIGYLKLFLRYRYFK